MQKKGDKYVLSAGDINGFLNCKRLTELDTGVANHQLKAPDYNNPHLKVMQQRGFEHERNYVQFLQQQGLSFESAEVADGEDGYQKTIELMKSGVDIITQGVLKLEGWYGRSDILKKVSTPSKLGDFSYMVMDTKLSRQTKAGSIMQLCLYSEMLSQIQGLMPEEMAVITPGEQNDFGEEIYRVDEYQAYYRLVRNQLLVALGKINAYPEPVTHCDICRWWESCLKRRRDDDHLSLVANIQKSQRKELESIGIHTMKALASADSAEFKKLAAKGNFNFLQAAKEQARVQVQARESGVPVDEFMPFEQGRGLSRLPEPNEGDLFFDIEGDTFVGPRGLEYLLGVSYLENAKLQYQAFWASNPAQEKEAFESLMKFILKRKADYPDFHIYHYASYETGAMKKLAQVYSLYQEELDQLLRAQKFVDLYSIVRQGIRASVESYSLKDLEIFTDYQRKIALNEMIVHKRALEHNLELSRFHHITQEMKQAVERYNRDDTDSTYYLRQWLESKRQQAIEQGHEIARPPVQDGQASEQVSERDETINKVKEKLLAAIDVDSAPKNKLTSEEEVKILLADLVGFYRREDKVDGWEYFRLEEMNEQELLEDKSGLAGLTLHQRIAPQGKGKVFTDIYRYPSQEADFRIGNSIFAMGEKEKVGTVSDFNPLGRTITITKVAAANDRHPHAIFQQSSVPNKPLEVSTLKVCEEIIENSLSGNRYKAIKDILQRRPPDSEVSLIAPEEIDPVTHACAVAAALKNSYLAIQGPPGAGKSYTASHMIESLLKKGKKIGVCAVSHKVVSGLLDSCQKLLAGQFTVIQKVKEKPQFGHYQYTTQNKDCEKLAADVHPVLIGATSWLFARDAMEQTLDYLFIDEGGQLSLANLIAVSRSAKNLIILGDCQQLQQPIQASHPDGAEVSALEFIQGDNATIPAEQGLFLAKTFRMHPEICRFNSELFYENRLKATAGNEGQVIVGPSDLKPLMYKEVSHSGNSNYSMEEVKFIVQLVNELVQVEHLAKIFNHGKKQLESKTLDLSDIMVIAPYNAQVQRLKDALPEGVQIGTVDKFQGREAAVVIYSVTSSSAQDCPRGMDFLYSANRLNVAVSRAQCSFIMVANREIFGPQCQSPAQMKLANAYCRFLELVSVDSFCPPSRL